MSEADKTLPSVGGIIICIYHVSLLHEGYIAQYFRQSTIGTSEVKTSQAPQVRWRNC